MRTGVEKSAAALDNLSKFHYNTLAIGVWRSLVSRLVRVQEASGSNPDTPTKNPVTAFAVTGFLIVVRDSNNLNATVRGTVAGEGLTEPNIYLRKAQMQTNPDTLVQRKRLRYRANRIHLQCVG